jgi:hypothetical protein
MKTLWKILEHKGKFATIIGFLLSLPVNSKFIYLYFKDHEFLKSDLTTIIVINVVAMIWFILPSKISIKSDKLTIEVED